MNGAKGPQLKGVVFDLDGTLVDSRLDFDLMRKEVGAPDGEPLLEFIEGLACHQERTHCHAIITKHETRGAEIATLMPGVSEFLERLFQLNLHLGILTRNLGGPTRLTIERLSLHGFSQIVTREDAPPKPDPTGLRLMSSAWGCEPEQLVFIGDYKFDLEAGHRAGMKTVLYAPGEIPTFAADADYVARSFFELAQDFEKVFAERLGFRIEPLGSK